MSWLELELWLAILIVAACMLACLATWAWEMLASMRRGRCRPDCPRLPGGCISKIGDKCAAWRAEK